jgi:hypothetical protein
MIVTPYYFYRANRDGTANFRSFEAAFEFFDSDLYATLGIDVDDVDRFPVRAKNKFCRLVALLYTTAVPTEYFFYVVGLMTYCITDGVWGPLDLQMCLEERWFDLLWAEFLQSHGVEPGESPALPVVNKDWAWDRALQIEK